MTQLVLISGHLCSGKSGLANALEAVFGYEVIKTSELLKTLFHSETDISKRLSLQKYGDQIDQDSGSKWIFDAVTNLIASKPSQKNYVIDHIRTSEQLKHFRNSSIFTTIHVHLYAKNEELVKRYSQRSLAKFSDPNAEYKNADSVKTTDDIDFFATDADVRINTARTDVGDTLVRVAARLGLYSPPDVRCVDVIIGGQYGSEGKGHISAYLAKDYDVLLRVGGPNAGHTVSSSSGVFTYHQLPSGAKDTKAKLLLGPGMTINVKDLLNEINNCNVTCDRLFIDPQAMIINEDDLTAEQELVKGIASTGRGSGNAAARRITGRGNANTYLAKDIPELEPYVGTPPHYRGSTTRQLEKSYREGNSILVEGTQGSALSIYHGNYPYVTSRDTNIAGCLAEAGISPSRVRRIIMVIRPTPIRVGNPDDSSNTSGPIKHETDFKTVAEAAGLDPNEVTDNEKTSTTRRARRVGWFDWQQFRSACALNAPTDIALTFTDYIAEKNSRARRFEQLSSDTIKFIEEIERVAHAPVSLINTRFPRQGTLDIRTVIDRRNWLTGLSNHSDKDAS